MILLWLAAAVVVYLLVAAIISYNLTTPDDDDAKHALVMIFSACWPITLPLTAGYIGMLWWARTCTVWKKTRQSKEQ